jgi:type II secretion system protein G
VSTQPAFTLIELLVVVAVVAILAAIAVPNFLEAQVRSKVSRAKADMATIATALEAYAVDNGTYPINAGGLGLTGALQNVLSPVAYLSSLPGDPFLKQASYFYFSSGSFATILGDQFGGYRLASVGPDGTGQQSPVVVYDPTNGTTSAGDIVVAQKSRDAGAVARLAGP